MCMKIARTMFDTWHGPINGVTSKVFSINFVIIITNCSVPSQLSLVTLLLMFLHESD